MCPWAGTENPTDLSLLTKNGIDDKYIFHPDVVIIMFNEHTVKISWNILKTLNILLQYIKLWIWSIKYVHSKQTNRETREIHRRAVTMSVEDIINRLRWIMDHTNIFRSEGGSQVCPFKRFPDFWVKLPCEKRPGQTQVYWSYCLCSYSCYYRVHF